jgi:hypothetical protein
VRHRVAAIGRRRRPLVCRPVWQHRLARCRHEARSADSPGWFHPTSRILVADPRCGRWNSHGARLPPLVGPTGSPQRIETRAPARENNNPFTKNATDSSTRSVQTFSSLLYAAEDALHIVSLQELDVQVITTVRLDLPADRARLEHTVEQLKPRLV